MGVLFFNEPFDAGVFAPTQLANCVLWLRSDLGITLNSGNVSAWADQTSNHNDVTQGSAAAQPAYQATGGPNSLPSILFNPANSQCLTNFSVNPLSGGTLMTLYIVLQSAVTTTAAPIVAIIVGGPSAGAHAGFGTSIGSSATTHRDFVLEGVGTDGDGNCTLSWEFWTQENASGPLQTMRVNGVGQTLSVNNRVATAPVAGLAVGAQIDTGPVVSHFWNGSVAEVILYSSAQSASDVTTVENYLHARYGL
jgi:hypothetical protein